MLNKKHHLRSYLISFVFLLTSTILNAQPTDSAVIVMYHHIGNNTPASTSVTLAQFDAHLDYLAQQQFNVWPLSKLVRQLQSKQPIPPKTIVLTADDAYISIYTEAYPRLKARNWPMTIFVNSEPIDKRYGNFMSWQQMRDMQEDGFEFANHTHTHYKMRPKQDESITAMQQRIRQEIGITQQRLQQELGADTNTNPPLFAYPYGEYSESAADYIQQLGYIAVAQVSGAVDHNSDFRALQRFPMAVNFAKIEDFRLKVNTKPLPIQQQTPWDPLVRDNPPILKLSLQHSIKQLACYNSRGEPLKMNWLSDTEVEMQSNHALKPPRDRYACTAPDKDRRWYWFGHLWIID